MAEYGKVYAEGFDPSQLVGRKKYAANTELEALGRIAAQQNRYNPVQMMQQAGKQSLTNIPYSAFNPTIGEAVTAGANMLPFIGDAAALSEAKQQLGQGNIGSAVFNAATALPVIGDIASVAKVALPTAAGIGGIIRQMSKRSGDVPVTPFNRQAGILGGSTPIKEGDIDLIKTGEPIRLNYVHNKESATKLFGNPTPDSPYGRWHEPSGKYITHTNYIPEPSDTMESGIVEFKNPLVIDNNDLQWKKELSDRYGGKRGKALSKALIKDGYDGVITIERGHTSEILDLTSFDPKKAKY